MVSPALADLHRFAAGVLRNSICFAASHREACTPSQNNSDRGGFRARSVDACRGGVYSEASGRREHQNGLAVTDP